MIPPMPTVTAPLTSTQNLNVASLTPLVTPGELEGMLPMSPDSHDTVVGGREAIRRILSGEDDRLLVVVGPCSIHDPAAALDYAGRLAGLRHKLHDGLEIVMRVYFEKPRTTVGWKGLINDPHLDGSFDMYEGLRLARKLLLDVTAMGLPCGTEFLDPFTPQYLDDLVSWAAIGARTTESQTHRQMASGLSMPVGYKNSTDGNLQVAIDAMQAARHAHHFVGIDEAGRASIVATRGNRDGHVILRGGGGRTNFEPADVADAAQRLADAGLPPAIMVDCSHANSGKQQAKQEGVLQSVLDQRRGSDPNPIMGIMIESNLREGNQPIPDDKRNLRYGVSITDACVGWEKTVELLEAAA